jgi:NCAIR mutase (PurE)-related protein
MDPQELTLLAEKLAAGNLSADEIRRWLARLRSEPSGETTARLATASVDLDRRRRCGFPEVVFGEGKSPAVLGEIFKALLDRGENVLATRIDAAKAAQLSAAFPMARYNSIAKTIRIARQPRAMPGVRADNPQPSTAGHHPFVAIITAGTSDWPVAEEARETLDWMGVRVAMIHDVGVAGPHRLPARLAEFQDADAIVVVAGMEGALPSMVGGYVACPVFGVPTSVGYGANFGGIAALLSMLNSCASNVAVVNIDAGFKAAYLAGLVATRCHAETPGRAGG